MITSGEQEIARSAVFVITEFNSRTCMHNRNGNKNDHTTEY